MDHVVWYCVEMLMEMFDDDVGKGDKEEKDDDV
jgi:hypothetical protein